MKRSPYFLLLLGVLALVVVAFVIIRTDSAAEGGDDSLLLRIALAVLYALMTVGPAFGAELALRALPRATQATRELRRRKTEWRKSVETKRNAEKAIKQVEDEYDAYLFWAAKAKGRYDRYWKKAHAKAGFPAVHGTSIPTTTTSPDISVEAEESS